MRRRVARVLRVGLFVLGTIVLVWMPISYIWITFVWIPVPGWDGSRFTVVSGVVKLDVSENWPGSQEDVERIAVTWQGLAELRRSTGGGPSLEAWLRPDAFQLSRTVEGRFAWTTVAAPLWAMAPICLAWPVTSFIFARRRHKRGFPVEPKAGGEAVSPPASSS